MNNEWRLIIEEAPRSGPANMAVDQAIAEACAAGEVPTTLRFYRWQPPTVSLGRHQRLSDVDLSVIEQFGYDLVRRPTGGRAILHTDEMTYSVAGREDDPVLQGGVMDAYLRLSNALVVGLQQLAVYAIDKAAAHVRAGPNVSAACFEIPSAYELTADGRKLMGSAQSRRAGYVLQHGSLPLVGDIGRLVNVLALSEEKKQQLADELRTRACTLAQALQVNDDDPRLEFMHVVQAFCQGFRQELDLQLKPASLTAAELRQSARLIREQYANPEWTNYRL